MLNSKNFPTIRKSIIPILLIKIAGYGMCVCLFVISAYAQEQNISPAGKKTELTTVNRISTETPPKSGCNFLKNIVDEKKGTVAKMMEREKIIAHTPDKMKKLFPDDAFITMEGYLNNFNGDIVFFLKISIQTNSPQDIYGSIFKENKLLLKLTTGETITLSCGQSDAGNVDLSHTQTNFMTFFPLNEETMSKLQSAEVTKARLFWAKGYEDYGILLPDFFKRQIVCVR